jgi:UTP--glucose-1-phosphate uridylyltransferase
MPYVLQPQIAVEGVSCARQDIIFYSLHILCVEITLYCASNARKMQGILNSNLLLPIMFACSTIKRVDMEKVISKAVILAAGHGSRFLPVTKAVPKEMLAVGDKPALHYIIKEAADSGMTDIALVISRDKEVVRHYFDADYPFVNSRPELTMELDDLLSKVNITYIYQDERTGSGSAVALCREFTGGDPFVVLNGDDIVFGEVPVAKQLADAYYATGLTVVGVQERCPEEAVKYGVIKCGKSKDNLTEILQLIEKPSIEGLPSNLCSLGRFLLTPEIYPAIAATPEVNGEVYLTTAIDVVASAHGGVACTFSGQRFDIGDKQGYLTANAYVGAKTYGERYKAFLKTLL